MILLAAIVVARGMSQSEIQVNDARWEQALHVAEGGLDSFLADMALASDPDGLTTGHYSSQFVDKAAIVALADAHAQLNPGQIVSSPEGQAIVLKPADDRVVYAVGWTPERAVAGRKARVVEIRYDFATERIPNWTADLAFLTGGDGELDSASSGVYDSTGNAAAHVHANGTLSVHSNFTLQGCATSAGSGTSEGANCPPPGPIPTMVIPDVDPAVVHQFADYDLCPDGVMRVGPANSLGTPGAAPCTGAPVTLTGWSSSVNQGIRTWAAGIEPPGTYYVHEGNFDGQFGGNIGPRAMSLIASPIGGDRTCSNIASTGNIYLNAGTWLTGDPDTGGLTVVAGADVKFRGNATVEGLTIAHEQIDFRGGTGNGGAVVAESACDHPDSPVNGTSSISGGTGITWAGSIVTPFEGYSDALVLVVMDRKES